MKKLLLLLCSFALALGTSTAQISLTDDFESYTVGEYLGANSLEWTTWSGSEGGAEDVRVVDNNAASGTQSIYFNGTGANGGPQDVVLPFGDKYTEGQFNYSMNILIEEGSTGAYFNFQAETTIGQVWATQIYFNADGTIDFADSDNAIQIEAEYEPGTWLEVAYEINLTANSWAVLIDGICIGAFSNSANSVASLDLFPLNGNRFWVDDVRFEYDPSATVPAFDLGIASLDLRPKGITGTERPISGSVVNNGTENVTSFDLAYNDGGADVVKTFDGLDMAQGETMAFQLDAPYTFVEGDQPITLTITDVNGNGADENNCNDQRKLTMTGYTPAPGKKVVVEEGTGTWCQWCPRGEVFMNAMIESYPDHYIGIAVHNGDPMAVPEYDDGLGISAFPNMAIMREENFGFGVIDDIESRFFQRLVEAPPATVESGADYDPSTRLLTVTSAATVNEDLAGNYRLAVVLVEDGVMGSGSGYAQVNAYAGGNFGPMGGYENLPSPVPASQMVYDHVGRILVGGFNGAPGSVASNAPAGSYETYTFDAVEIPAVYITDNMMAVTLLLAPNGTIVNAEQQSFEELTNTVILATDEPAYRHDLAEVTPNPFSGTTTIRLKLEGTSSVQVNVVDAMGKLVASRDYGKLAGEQVLPFEAGNLASGIYFIHIRLDDALITRRVILK